MAARAAGTSPRTPVGDYYASLSGTSMATPHVAGAAAILAQQHPDWGGDRLKPTLMSTSRDVGYNAYEQGAGRLDVARAVRQTVYTTTASVDFRAVTPDGAERISRQISYVNATDQPATLALSASST